MNTKRSEHSEKHLTEQELSAYLEKDLSEKDLVYADKHIENCKLCSDNLRSLDCILSLLKNLPEVSLPDNFTEKVMSNVKNSWAFKRRIFLKYILKTPIIVPILVTSLLLILIRQPELDNIQMPAISRLENLSQKAENSAMPPSAEQMKEAQPVSEGERQAHVEAPKLNATKDNNERKKADSNNVESKEFQDLQRLDAKKKNRSIRKRAIK